TVIFRERSPFATAVVTSAMLRTCVVRLFAIELTLSVSAFQVPAAFGTSAWPPSTPSVPTSRATPVTWSAKTRSVSIIALIVSAVRDRGDDARDAAHLRRQVRRHEVDVLGQILPGAADALHLRLTAEHA